MSTALRTYINMASNYAYIICCYFVIIFWTLIISLILFSYLNANDDQNTTTPQRINKIIHITLKYKLLHTNTHIINDLQLSTIIHKSITQTHIQPHNTHKSKSHPPKHFKNNKPVLYVSKLTHCLFYKRDISNYFNVPYFIFYIYYGQLLYAKVISPLYYVTPQNRLKPLHMLLYTTDNSLCTYTDVNVCVNIPLAISLLYVSIPVYCRVLLKEISSISTTFAHRSTQPTYGV